MLRNQRIIALMILAVLIFGACQPVVLQTQSATQPSNEEVVAAVNAIWDEYEESQMESDPERWIALWTDDGVKMPPNGPALEGKEPIFDRVQRGMKNAPTDEMVITALETQGAGDWAYSRGVYTATITMADTGERELLDGKFMTILQRQPDGSWKIHRDIHNSNVPPAEPVTTMAADTEAATEAIQALWKEYSASALVGDPERRLALWDDEGIQMPPDREARVGKETIRVATEASMAKVIAHEYVVSPEEIEVFGDLAFARGTYMANRSPVDGGDPVQTNGKFMTILKRQTDGSWKIYRDIFNSNVPPVEPGADLAALSAELHQRFSDNDLEGAAAMADDSIKMVGYGLGLNLEGRDQFLAFMQARKRAFPDITLEYTNTVVQGDQVVVEFIATGTHLGPLMTPNGEIEPTGKPVTLHVVEIHTWKDGKLVSIVQYQDPTSPLRQIGVLQ